MTIAGIAIGSVMHVRPIEAFMTRVAGSTSKTAWRTGLNGALS
jgi:hypothetical protein